MGIQQATVSRIYKCLSCKIEISVNQTTKEDFLRVCPNCSQEELVIKHAKLSIGAMVDSHTVKTVGMLAEKNTDKMIKEGKLPKGKPKPFWRKSKVNYNVLKNPEKYIKTGQA